VVFSVTLGGGRRLLKRGSTPEASWRATEGGLAHAGRRREHSHQPSHHEAEPADAEQRQEHRERGGIVGRIQGDGGDGGEDHGEPAEPENGRQEEDHSDVLRRQECRGRLRGADE